ncbi:uncharacterized protein LOC122653592 [Telopea speciosissima]|uniref:uncharacterized protein LOC122653592 n=1 Tax=Telopea speciosissima TaxID=54955 RepID=UPI001CC59353|nr:uncharacterized protein LOC122653592 [Telopea speciosissima]XP_043703420.1 uncharacterized protein LOC122653592 [Telopea speciosissima]
MKNRASVFLKQIISVLSSVVKAKSLALKNKTSAIKTRLIILSMLKNKKVLLSSIAHKLHALVPGQQDDSYKIKISREDADDQSSCSNNNNAIVLFNSMANQLHSNPIFTELIMTKVEEENEENQEEDEYPDLTHSLFDSEEPDELDLADPGSSVIDLVRNSKELEGENFKLEDEIDHVADLFIRKFHRQIKMQKLDSFKRYQEMLERSV